MVLFVNSKSAFLFLTEKSAKVNYIKYSCDFYSTSVFKDSIEKEYYLLLSNLGIVSLNFCFIKISSVVNGFSNILLNLSFKEL